MGPQVVATGEAQRNPWKPIPFSSVCRPEVAKDPCSPDEPPPPIGYNPQSPKVAAGVAGMEIKGVSIQNQQPAQHEVDGIALFLQAAGDLTASPLFSEGFGRIGFRGRINDAGELEHTHFDLPSTHILDPALPLRAGGTPRRSTRLPTRPRPRTRWNAQAGNRTLPQSPTPSVGIPSTMEIPA